MSLRTTVFLFLAILALTTSASEPFRIRVLSYNIHHGAGVDGKLDLERIARVIKSVNPDIVALQECDQKTQRTGGVDQPAELARLTEMHGVFGENIRFGGGQYGNAVLSKFPIAKHENAHLPCFDDGEQRGMLICEIRPKELGTALLFCCTHLDHRPDSRERLASAKRINEWIQQRGQTPAILAGDLNATPSSSVLTEFSKAWRISNQQKLATVPVTKPSRQIDFILSRPLGRWKALETTVLSEAVASDHRAIFALLELSPE